MPPVAEQKRIATRVEHLMSLCDKLEEALKRKEQIAQRLAEAMVAAMVA